MSWWDTSSFSSLATQAFKNAQQRIDKVLDIKDDEEDAETTTDGATASKPEPSPSVSAESDASKAKSDDSFWSAYLGVDNLTGFTSTPSKSDSVSKPTARTLTPTSGKQTSGTTERTELKTSATSAFTVRSKRVESTLKKFNVKSDLLESSTSSLSTSLEEKKETPSHGTPPQESSPQPTPPQVAPPRESPQEILVNKPSQDKETGGAGDQATQAENDDISKDKNISQTDPVKRSAPLKLGSSLTKKTSTETEKKLSEEKAKAETAAIEAQVASLLESDNNKTSLNVEHELKADEKLEESPPTSVDSSEISGDRESHSKSSEWSTLLDDGNLQMESSDTGCGWEAEDLDIEELSDIDSVSGSVHADTAAPSESETPMGKSDTLQESSAETHHVLTGNQTDPSTNKDFLDESSIHSVTHIEEQVLTVETDSSPSSEKDACDIPKSEETLLLKPGKELEVKEAEEEKELQEDEITSQPLVEEKTESEVELDDKQNIESFSNTRSECPERLQVSFESSDTAEGGSDELSESSRTLTGEDFSSSLEDNVDGNKRGTDVEISEKPTELDQDYAKCGTKPDNSKDDIDKSAIESCEGEEKDGAHDPVEVTSSVEMGGDLENPQGKSELTESSCSNPGLVGVDKKGLVSSSYVKTMIEEAMVESVKDTDSHTSSTSDKSSEMVRIESGMNSGHTSGDEIDTTTSSDIEIISTPTPNGEYRQERPFDLSPLRHALSRTMRRGSPPGHKRSDSSSSGQSTWSKNGDEAMSPDGGHHREGEGLTRETLEEGPENVQMECIQKDQAEKDTTGKNVQEASGDPLEAENLLKEAEKSEREPVALSLLPGNHLPASGQTLDTIVEKVEPTEISTSPQETPNSPDGVLASVEEQTNDFSPQELLEKLAEMAEVLDARERKMVDLSKENIALEEAKSILKNQLKQSEEAREAELEDLNTITEEFTARLADFEQRQQATVRERDNLKKQLSGAQNELAKKTNSSSGMEKLLREKDQQISELLEEGEKLSKQQLQSNNIIKKLRTKEKDNETLLKTQKTKLDQQTEELTHLRKVLDAKEDLEKKQIEAINQQNLAIKKQEAQLMQLKTDYEDIQEKARGLQVALDNSYKEISELHKAKAAAASETQTARLSVEMQAKQELQIAMERQQQTHKQDIEAFLTQIEDHQMSLVRQEREQGRREDVLRQEISDLQKRLQEAEERNQDLTQSVTSATRPLLRQIENLQSTYAAQSGSYEKLERSLTERLNEAQTSLAEAVEKERAANEQLMDISSRITSLETQVSSLRQEKSRIAAQLEVEKTKIIVLEDAKNSETAQLEALKARNSEEIISLKKEKLLLENQIEMEKMKVEAEKKKLMFAHEQLRDKELQLQRQAMTPSPRSSTRDDSIHSEPTTPMSTSLTQEEILEKTLLLGSANGSSSSLYESLRHSGAAALMENLQSQLKLKEGEIVQLQSEIKDLEQTRESMARELVNLSGKNDELGEQLAEYPSLKRAHKDLDARYQALLQMYGEKVEEAEELSMDLHDIKDMYKAQIEELLKRVR